MIKVILWGGAIIGLFVIFLFIVTWAITFHPAEMQAERVACADQSPSLRSGQSIKVLTYNVQYMAGKNYVFFYDLPNDAGPDERPSSQDITQTVEAVARIIRAEAPDIILLQEVDDGSARTDYEDQLARLLSLLPTAYKCHTSAFYWQAGFVPHPRIMGAVGQKLSIISKYQIVEATRYQLAIAPADPITRQFRPKRAILAARLPVEDAEDLMVLTTHLEVAWQGARLKQQEIAQIAAQLNTFDQAGQPWLLGGDFNLLPPGQLNRLRPDQRGNFRSETELKLLYDRYRVVPGLSEVNGADYQAWFTMFPNNPSLTGPDRTVDYIFYADSLTLTAGYVRRHDTLAISDHLPAVAVFELP
jgi:endonuclease/exonuclease/phosphatase family metal-dependent hydrolase